MEAKSPWLPKQVHSAVKAFLIFMLLERNASQHTARNYHDAVQGFLAFIGPLPLQAVGQAEVRAFLRHEHTERGLGMRSIASKLTVLRCFFRFLVQEGVIRANPAADIVMPRYARPLPRFLDEQQVRQLLQAPLVPTWQQLRDAAILETLYSTGMWVNELMSLNVEDLDPQSGTITVRMRQERKRRCQIAKPAMERIRQYLASRPHTLQHPQALFVCARAGRRMVVRDIGRLVPRYGRRIRAPFAISPTVLRHTFASHLLDHGADLVSLREMLGHVNLGTTAAYLRITPRRLMSAYAAAHPRA